MDDTTRSPDSEATNDFDRLSEFVESAQAVLGDYAVDSPALRKLQQVVGTMAHRTARDLPEEDRLRLTGLLYTVILACASVLTLHHSFPEMLRELENLGTLLEEREMLRELENLATLLEERASGASAQGDVPPEV